MPSSAACSGSITSIDSPLRAAMSRAASARTIGLTSLLARLASVRATLAPSPMIRPRSAARVSAAASAPGATRISSSSAGGADSTVGQVDRLGLVAAFDDAAHEQLGDGRVAAVDMGPEIAQPDRQEWTARPPSRRSIVAPSRWIVSRLSASPSPAPTASSRPAGRSPDEARAAW